MTHIDTRCKVDSMPHDADAYDEIEEANMLLAEDAICGLQQALAGKFVSDTDLDNALRRLPFDGRSFVLVYPLM
jgi:hypothetical protein